MGRPDGRCPRGGLCACLLWVALAWACVAQGASPDYITVEEPVPETVKDNRGLILEGGGEEAERRGGLLPGFRQRLAGLPPFWRDSRVELRPRSFYMNQGHDQAATREAWVAGGILRLRSGWWRRLRLTAAAYTTQKLYGPQDRDGTRLLAPGQDSFSVLGEAYAEVRLPWKMALRGGRTSFNLPYLNRHDIRMLPNTFEAYGIMRDVGEGLSFIVLQVEKMKRWESDRFVSMTQAAGLTGQHEGLTSAGLRWGQGSFNAGVISYYSRDFMSTLYGEGNLSWSLGEEVALAASAQYTDQRSVGDDLGGRFNSDVWGLRLAVSYRHGILTLAHTRTDRGADIISPFGSYPGYLSIIVDDFRRAGENAWLLGVDYRFTELGLPGLSAFANYAWGDTPDRGLRASPDQTELDFTLDYRFQQPLLQGLWLRARAAFVDRDDDVAGADDVDDLRIILNYEVDLF